MDLGLLVICGLTFVIHLIGTLAYSVRIAGSRTGRIALSLSLFNILILLSRTSNSFQAPLLAKRVEQRLAAGSAVASNADFRWLLVSATMATIVGAFLIPTFQRLSAVSVDAFGRQRSICSLTSRALSPATLAHLRESVVLPSWRNVAGVHTQGRRRLPLFAAVLLIFIGLRPAASAAAPLPGPDGALIRVASKDGTLIAIECAGSGPSLVIVHGGIGDRTRWTPMFPLLSARFRVCAMDRRGHGASDDSPDYSLSKEAEDVAAVVDSRPGTVFLLGHSYGGVAALEAAFLTKNIVKLVLYEPPLQDRVDLAVVDRIEMMLRHGKGEGAVVTFLREIVRLPPAEVTAMRSRPSWPKFVADIKSQPREMRALAAYRFDAKRMSTVHMPTLLITGADTASPRLKDAISSLQASLPNPTLLVLEGQQHNAMDSGRQSLADAVTRFLLDTSDRAQRK